MVFANQTEDSAITLYYFLTGEFLWRVPLPRKPGSDATLGVTAIVFDNASQRLAVGTADGMILILTTEDGQLIRTIEMEEPIYSLTFSGDGSKVLGITRPYDGVPPIRYWSVFGAADGQLDFGSWAIAMIGASDVMAIGGGGESGSLLLDVTTSSVLARFDVPDVPSGFSSSQNGDWLAGWAASKVYVWRTTGEAGIVSQPVPENCTLDNSQVAAQAWISSEGILATLVGTPSGLEPPNLQICDLLNQRALGEIESVVSAQFLRDQKILVRPWGEPTRAIWSVE